MRSWRGESVLLQSTGQTGRCNILTAKQQTPRILSSDAMINIEVG